MKQHRRARDECVSSIALATHPGIDYEKLKRVTVDRD